MAARGASSATGVEPAAPSDTPALFDEQAEAAGLDFHHFNGMTGDFHMPEITGAGVGLFDYDNDGDLDVYLVQGRLLRADREISDAIFPPRHPLPLGDRLYRNDLRIAADGSRTLRFTDVTAESGLEAQGYGMGVATGDFDNDGWVDLYVTNLGSNQLWRNLGDGTFADVTRASGTDDARWSVPAVFVDYDRDGRLDLFVGNYIAFSVDVPKVCRGVTGAPDYCGPSAFPPLPDRLFRNLGDGTFEDVTYAVGIRQGFGGALGVVTADLNGDGWPDLYVANDQLPNQMWLSRGDGTFSDEAFLGGSAVNSQGRPEASMGVDAGDFDGDGDFDLFMTHLTGETNTIYLNDGRGMFDDHTVYAGLGVPSRMATAFGTGWLDYDNDGWLDLFTANGAVKAIEGLARENDPYPHHQPNQLYRNLSNGRFEEATATAGAVFELSEVSRGTAFGDLDNDGDTDLVIANNNGPARLLINELGSQRSWLGLRVLDAGGRTDRLGARVAVLRPGLPALWRRVRTDGSFASANDPRVLFGLGESPAVEAVRVHWPGGRIEEWTDLPLGRYGELRQGAGKEVPPSTGAGST